MKFIKTALALGTAVFLSACGKAPSPAVEKAPPTPPPVKGIPVGAFLPLSGAQAAFGQSALAGMKMAVKEWNASGGISGKPVELVIRDTESDPDRAAQAVRELVEKENAIALLGEVTSESSLKAAPVAGELGIPMISPSATHSKLTDAGPMIFRVCYSDLFQGLVMSKFARSIGVSSAAILWEPGNEYSADLAASFEKDFLDHSGKIAAKETYQKGSVDFSAALQAIKAAQPEVIFLPSYFPDAAKIIKQARTLGLDQPFIGTDGWESQEFLSAGGEAVNNTYFASHFSAGDPSEKTSSFVTSYREANGGDPLATAALGYDSVLFLADGIRRAGGTDPAALQTALAATSGFEGVTGTITLDAQRNPSKPAIVVRVSEGKFNYLETVAP